MRGCRPASALCAERSEWLTGERPGTALSRRARAFAKTVGLGGPGVDLCNKGDLSTERSISCLEDDDGNHKRGGERSGEGVCIFAGHMYWLLLGGEGVLSHIIPIASDVVNDVNNDSVLNENPACQKAVPTGRLRCLRDRCTASGSVPARAQQRLGLPEVLPKCGRNRA